MPATAEEVAQIFERINFGAPLKVIGDPTNEKFTAGGTMSRPWLEGPASSVTMRRRQSAPIQIRRGRQLQEKCDVDHISTSLICEDGGFRRERPFLLHAKIKLLAGAERAAGVRYPAPVLAQIATCSG